MSKSKLKIYQMFMNTKMDTPKISDIMFDKNVDEFKKIKSNFVKFSWDDLIKLQKKKKTWIVMLKGQVNLLVKNGFGKWFITMLNIFLITSSFEEKNFWMQSTF